MTDYRFKLAQMPPRREDHNIKDTATDEVILNLSQHVSSEDLHDIVEALNRVYGLGVMHGEEMHTDDM